MRSKTSSSNQHASDRLARHSHRPLAAVSFANDPADQITVATARVHGLPLMTADKRIRKWGKVPIL